MIVIEDGRKSFTQWDKGIYVLIDEGCDSIDVSRSDKKVSKNVKVQRAGSVFRAAIPDAMLTEAGYLNISCIAEEKDGNRTISTYRFRITPRAKPDNYAFGHEELGSWKALLLRMNALERAAREGQFDGSPGVGIQAVEPYLTAEMSGFGNIYHVILTNGKIFELVVYNGRDGKNGADGNPGADGTGIERIEAVSISTASGGESIYRIVLTNGTQFDYSVRNGEKGEKGETIESVTIEPVEEQTETDPYVTKSYVMRIIETDESTVRYNAPQEKTEAERLVAQYNVGIINTVSGILSKQDYDDQFGMYVSGMRLYIKKGKALVDGVMYENKNEAGNGISTSTSDQRRAYLIRLDRSTRKAMPYLKVLRTGTDSLITYSEGDTLPLRNESYYDIVIGYIDIPANTTELTADMIHDLRDDPAYCGYVEYLVGGGSGDGDMQKSVYDPNGKEKDIYKYADDISKLAVTNHALSDTTHTDIRELITGLTNRLNVLADSDDTTLDQLSEIVAYIKSNKSLIDAITTSKVSVSDIIDNLTTNNANKPLSAAQGVALKALIDGITIPEKLPNPNALTFTGAVIGSYDGSKAVSVEIPIGGGGSGESGGTTSTMTGATAETDGAPGLVPAPKAGEQNKFLRGDGTWAESDKTISKDGYAADAKAVGEKFSELSEAIANLGGTLVEPAEDDIPKVFFKGTAPTSKAEDELPLEMEYVSKSLRFHDYVTLKVQGDSSAGYPKKNFNLKMFSDTDRTEKDKRVFRDWSKTHKYCLKANWIDHTHARNVVNGRLWGQVVRTRADYESYPENYRKSANCGAVNGFPIKVYINGIYQGLYTWNIRKDESMFNMDDETGTHAALIADGVNAITAWRELPTISGGDWTDELNDVVPDAVRTSFQNAYTFVMQSTDEEFQVNIEQHFYLSSLIDYYIFIYSILMYGGLAKSQTMFTYDATKYLANIYDMDTTWALYWNGKSFLSVTTACPEEYEHTAGYNLLYERLVKNFAEEIKARYAELRSTVLSDANIINEFERFMDVIPPDLYAEDFASTTAGGKFTEIPSADTNNLQKLRDIIVNRMAYCDEQIPLIDAVEKEIPATGITLSASALTLTDSASQTLTATVEPIDTTDTVVWNSDDNSVATVTNGVVKPISNGSCVITATAGSVSATCTVTVDVEELVVLTGISATYTGGDVTAGTALTGLTGITVTATYSDGSTKEVTDYTLSGSISVGANTITVTYEGLTTTFTVTGTEMDYGDALYPLKNGTYTPVNELGSSWDYNVEITNGNHVKITNLSEETDYNAKFVNFTSPEHAYVNNIDTQFTFPANSSVKYEILNLTQAMIAAGMRIANSSSGVTSLAINSIPIGGGSKEATISEELNIGALFVYGNIKAGSSIEFDVSLIVNNQRYI